MREEYLTRQMFIKLIKRAAKRALAQMGYSVQKVGPVQPFLRRRKKFKKPLYVEFVGSVGVGKSYLHNRLIRSQRDWVDGNYFNLFLAKDIEHPLYENLARTKIDITYRTAFTSINKLRLLANLEKILGDYSLSGTRGIKSHIY